MKEIRFKSMGYRKPSERQTIKVPVSELRVGMFVSELDRPWLESPFLLQGFTLESQEDIHAVARVCEYVHVDSERSRAIQYKTDRHSDGTLGEILASRGSPKPTVTFEKEIAKATEAEQRTSNLLKSFMDDIRFGKAVDLQMARSTVVDLVGSILRNPSALMYISQIKRKDSYTEKHSFNVCVFAISLGRFIGLNAHDLENLGTCGLLHDLGKIGIPSTVLNKEGRLTAEEFLIMKEHAKLGRDILMSGRNVFDGSVDVAYGHHENLDGTGYPRGLEGHQMNLFTNIVSIVDKYDAITSHRIYQFGRPHLDALRILDQLSKENKVDRHLKESFIACMGIYPTGGIVELTTGEIAVVVEQNADPKQRLRPRIVLLRDPDGDTIPAAFVDLSKVETSPSGMPYRIRKIHASGAFDINLADFQHLLAG